MARSKSQTGKMSRQKGAAFERKIAKQLQEWWGEGEFARTPSSGGWGNKNAREEFNACGDVVTSAENFPFTIECKNQEKWHLELFLQGKGTDKVSKWLAQAIDETPEGKIFLLICKRNRQQPLVIVNDCINTRYDWIDDKAPPYYFYSYFLHNKVLYGIIMMTLENFLSINSRRFKK